MEINAKQMAVKTKHTDFKTRIANKTDRELEELKLLILHSNNSKLSDIGSYLKFFVILTLVGIAVGIISIVLGS